MLGQDIRCKACNQYAPDRCLCGESITNPAIKAQMAAARSTFEADITGMHGERAIKGSPHYEVSFVEREWRTFWHVWQAASAHHAQTQPRIPQELLNISRLLHTQNNRVTDQPLFIVQQKRSYVTKEGYNESRVEWRETKSGDHVEASPLRAKRLDLLYHYERDIKGWERYLVFDVWEFVTACFTEQGCKDYLEINGHNLGETRIYAEGSYRNCEYQIVRNWIMSLTPAPETEKIHAAHR